MTPYEQQAVDSLPGKIRDGILTGPEAMLVLKVILDTVWERYEADRAL
jgi:hypothetical protein